MSHKQGSSFSSPGHRSFTFFVVSKQQNPCIIRTAIGWLFLQEKSAHYTQVNTLNFIFVMFFQGQPYQKDKGPVSPNLLQKAKKSLTSSFESFMSKRVRTTHPILFLRRMVNLTYQQQFSVVGTIIDYNVYHHSGQNVVDPQGAAVRDHMLTQRALSVLLSTTAKWLFRLPHCQLW